MTDRIYADDVKVDDLIMWAGRVVEVKDVRPQHPTNRRPGRYLMCAIGADEDVRRLHYFDNEVVVLHHRPAHSASGLPRPDGRDGG
jgi:hypothetical protein